LLGNSSLSVYKRSKLGFTKKVLYIMVMEKEKIYQELVDVLKSQVIDLTMMSKIELGDDVIEKIKRLRAIINE